MTSGCNTPLDALLDEFGWQHTVWDYDQVNANKAIEELRAKIHALFAVRSESVALDKLSAFMVRVDADVDLCYPGNHGGPDDAWLVTVTRQGANDIRESFGKTLAEAINKAVEAAEDD